MTITDVIIKTPDRKWDWDENDVMPGSEGLGMLVILKKSSLLRSDAGRSELRSDAGRSELRSDAGRSELRFEAGRGESSLWPTECAARLLGQMGRSA